MGSGATPIFAEEGILAKQGGELERHAQLNPIALCCSVQEGIDERSRRRGEQPRDEKPYTSPANPTENTMPLGDFI